jgi:Tol biopolymer transport system component
MAFQENKPPDRDRMGLYVVGGAFKTPKKVADDTSIRVRPSWAPDNNRFAYVTVEPEYDVYIYTLATGVSEKVHPGEEKTHYPAWSPDGKHIAYIVNDESDTLHILNMEDKTSRITIPNGTFAAWSPDGTQFAFWDTPGNRYDGIPDLKVMNIDGTNQRLLVNLRTRNVNWSPDGTQLAYQVAKEDGVHICMVTIETAKERCLILDNGSFELGPVWSPDGKKLAFSATDRTFPGFSVFIINADDSDLTLIEDSPNPFFLMWW